MPPCAWLASQTADLLAHMWVTKPPIYFGDSPLSWYLMARCGVPSMGVHFLDYSHDAQATLQQPEA